MTGLLLVLLLVLLAGVVGAVALARSSKRQYARQNDVVPGVRSSAPASWAGAHTAEAKLHRRLRDAVRSLYQHPRADDPSFASLRSALEQQALAVDERLVAASALPDAVRDEPLARAAGEVAAVEGAAASLSEVMLTDAVAGTGALDDVTERLRLLAEARAELEDATPPRPAEADGHEPGTASSA